MLTVRIEWHSPDFPSYSLYTCQHVTVNHVEGGSIRIYLSTGAPGADSPSHEILLGDRCVMYVMNEVGKTVDVVRGPDPRTSESRGQGQASGR